LLNICFARVGLAKYRVTLICRRDREFDCRGLLTAVQRSDENYGDAMNLHFDHDVNLQAGVVADAACRAYL
jgi:hypothetical protein